MVTHACNDSSWETEAERSRVQSHPQLQSESEASLTHTGEFREKVQGQRHLLCLHEGLNLNP